MRQIAGELMKGRQGWSHDIEILSAFLYQKSETYSVSTSIRKLKMTTRNNISDHRSPFSTGRGTAESLRL